jgi:hypothetical protein
MNNIEEFIKSNREAFDDKEPRDKLWTRIESDLDESPRDFGWIWKAAVVVLVAVCGFLIWERGQIQSEQTVMASEVYVDPEFVETELYYTQLINQKMLAVDNFKVQNPQIEREFDNDIASLDTMYQELKQEYIETGNEVVLDAMMNNLQLRKELLDQELMILENIENNYQNEKYEVEYL